MLPTQVMARPARDFWMNADIHAAGLSWEQDQRQQARQDGQAGAATEGEKQDLTDQQEARADRREDQDGQPDLEDQLDALRDAQAGGDPSTPGQGGR